MDVQQTRKNPRSDENTTPPPGKMQSENVIEAAETLIAMQQTKRYSPDQIIQNEYDRPALTEKLHIIENIKLN